MRRGLVAAVGLIVVTGLSAAAVAAPKRPTKRAMTETLTGAQISTKGRSSEAVYKVFSSLDGTGGGIQEITVAGTALPLSGKDTFTSYFADGVSKTKDTFKLGVVNASGISAISGSGKGGTGPHKKEKCTYTFKGTYDTKTTLTRVKVTGTDTR